MPLEAVLFDLDGTLIDSERDNVESVVRAVRGRGCELDQDDCRFIVGHSWNEIHERITRKHGFEVDRDALIAEAVREKFALVAQNGYVLLPGAMAALDRLGAIAPLALVSGSSCAEITGAVDRLGVRARFRVLLGAEDYQRGKPDPQPYELAMQKLGVAAQGCLVIEDSEPGVLAGRAAGAKVVAVRAGNFSGYDLSVADVVVDTLDDITMDVVARLVP